MINRVGLLVSLSKKSMIHKRMWESEWNRNNTTELSYAQFLILNILNTEGPKQSKQLVEELSITSGGITSISDKLISLGLINKTRDVEKDRRGILLEITGEGRVMLEPLKNAHDQTFNMIYSKLTDGEIAFLEHIYGKMISVSKE